jgi:5-methyltetrahydropteroyltriglutamate--homocysteine methyltransferase
MRACIAAGADFVQVDDPSLGIIPGEGRATAELVNRVFDGVQAKNALHICFGTNRGRPRGFNRTYRPLFPDILDAKVDQFVLEFSNRQMADIDLWREYQLPQELVLGVVDQKCYEIETPEFVADRIRTALKYVPAEKPWISSDCGMSGSPYWIGMGKLRAMMDGVAIVRRELAG